MPVITGMGGGLGFICGSSYVRVGDTFEERMGKMMMALGCGLIGGGFVAATWPVLLPVGALHLAIHAATKQ